MLDGTDRTEPQPWRKPAIDTTPAGQAGYARTGPDSADSRWTVSSLSSPAPSNGATTPVGLIKASPWPDVPVHAGRLRSPVLQEGDDWYAIDVTEPEMSGPSDPDLYNMPMVPKGPGRIDSAAEDVSSAEGQSTSAPKPAGTGFRCTDPCGCMGRGGATVCHLLSLLVAERPMRKHREWAGKVVPDARLDAELIGPESPATPTKASLRRKLTFQAVSGRILEGAEERRAYPLKHKKRRLAYAIRRKQTRSYTGIWDRLADEVFILGEAAFDLCTPLRMDSHLPWITSIFIAVQLITFTFMAGEYPAFLAAQGGLAEAAARPHPGAVALAPAPRGGGIRAPLQGIPHSSAAGGCPPSSYGSGPQALIRWASHWDACYRFRPDYLLLWGARSGEALRDGHQWWRWGSSLLLVESAAEMGAQIALLASLGFHLEPRYGTTRITLLLLLGALAGNFLDAAVLNICRLGLGCAAASCSLLTLFVGDFLFNFESIRYPFLRLFAFLGGLGVFIAAAVLLGYPYGLSPLGAVLATVFPGALILPHLKSEKYEWFVPYLSLLSVLIFVGAIPAFLYLLRLPRAMC